MFLAALCPELRTVGYDVALGGSVLTRGASAHDLDLVVFPLRTSTQNRSALLVTLERFGMHRQHSVEVVHARWRALGSRDEKHVEVWVDWAGRRIDLFFLR